MTVGNEPTIPVGSQVDAAQPVDLPDDTPVITQHGLTTLGEALRHARAPGEAQPTDRMWVRWSTDGEHMRKWAREPFDGAVEFVRPSARDGECERLREALGRIGDKDAPRLVYDSQGRCVHHKPLYAKCHECVAAFARAALSADRSDPAGEE